VKTRVSQRGFGPVTPSQMAEGMLCNGDMSAPLDLFADDVIRTAYTRLLPLTLLTGIAAVLCRAVIEKLVSVGRSAFRKKSVRHFIERLSRSATRLRSEAAGKNCVRRPEPVVIEALPKEAPSTQA
jgi:hypothetical protein